MWDWLTLLCETAFRNFLQSGATYHYRYLCDFGLGGTRMLDVAQRVKVTSSISNDVSVSEFPASKGQIDFYDHVQWFKTDSFRQDHRKPTKEAEPRKNKTMMLRRRWKWPSLVRAWWKPGVKRGHLTIRPKSRGRPHFPLNREVRRIVLVLWNNEVLLKLL